MEKELTILGTRERHLGPQGYLLRYYVRSVITRMVGEMVVEEEEEEGSEVMMV
jgi:hypothetical protein